VWVFAKLFSKKLTKSLQKAYKKLGKKLKVCDAGSVENSFASLGFCQAFFQKAYKKLTYVFRLNF